MLKHFALLGSVAAVLICEAGDFAAAQAKVKAKYPKEFAEVQKLAASDMAAAQKKLFELARKGNITLPRAGRSAAQSGFNRQSRGRGGRGIRGGRGGMGMMRMGQFNLLKRFAAESQIKSKFASEYAAADKALLDAVARIEELARISKVSLPLSTELQIRKLRAKAPEEFAKLEEQSSSDPRKVFSGLRELAGKHKIELWERRDDGRGGSRSEHTPPPPAPVRSNPMHVIRTLQRKYPEEMREIMALRRSDPREFSRRLQELNKRAETEKNAPKQ